MDEAPKDEVISQGITDDDAWHQMEALSKRLDDFKYEFKRVLSVMEERRSDHLIMIECLLRENVRLRLKLKGLNVQ